MTTATSIHTPNRIAAGVTTAYLRDLTRRPAASPGDGRRRAVRRRGVATSLVRRPTRAR